MSSQKKITVLRPKRPNDSTAEAGPSTKNPRRQKENNLSISPSRLFEKFEMSTSFFGFGEKWKDQEMDCADQCKLENIGSKPTYFTGSSQVHKNDNNKVLDVHLGISVSKDRGVDIDNYEPIFSSIFSNHITDESWPHIQHFFTHLLEPHGTIQYVSLIQFNMKMWNALKTSHPNFAGKINTEKLKIDFDKDDFEWAIDFGSTYCIAETLEWTLESDLKLRQMLLSDECMDAIGGFIGSQGDNFDKFVLTYEYDSYNIDEFAGEIVKMFKNLEDPSKMVKHISLKLFNCTRFAHSQMRQVAKVFPFSMKKKKDIFNDSYRNQNSDYILETDQSEDNGWRTINFTVIEPTSQ